MQHFTVWHLCCPLCRAGAFLLSRPWTCITLTVAISRPCWRLRGHIELWLTPVSLLSSSGSVHGPWPFGRTASSMAPGCSSLARPELAGSFLCLPSASTTGMYLVERFTAYRPLALLPLCPSLSTLQGLGHLPHPRSFMPQFPGLPRKPRGPSGRVRGERWRVRLEVIKNKERRKEGLLPSLFTLLHS